MSDKITLFFVMLLIATVHCFSDIYAPFLLDIGLDFGVDETAPQFSLAIFMIGVAFSQLFYGVYSDSFGRKQAILLGSWVVLVGSVVSVLAQSMNVFILGRLIQGCGAGAYSVMWRGVLRDRFSGNALIRYGSWVTLVFVLFITGSPFLGNVIADFARYSGVLLSEWRVVFIVLTMMGLLLLISVWLAFQETNQDIKRSLWNMNSVQSMFKGLFRDRHFMCLCLCVLCTFGSFFSWFVVGPIFIPKLLLKDEMVFSTQTLLVGGSMMFIATVMNTRIVGRWGIDAMLRLGWALMTLGGCVLLMVALMDMLNVFSLFFALGVFIFGSGFIYPNLFARVMEPYGHQAGIAGSIYGFVQMLGAGIASSIMAITPETTVIPYAVLLMVGGLAPQMMYHYGYVKSR